jgi:hypothetical protein
LQPEEEGVAAGRAPSLNYALEFAL